MKRKDEPLDNGHRLGDFKDFDAQLLAAFSKTSAIEVAIYDSQLRFLAVNKAASAVPGIRRQDNSRHHRRCGCRTRGPLTTSIGR